MTTDPCAAPVHIGGHPTHEEAAAVLAVLLARPAVPAARSWRDERLTALRRHPRDPEWCRIVW